MYMCMHASAYAHIRYSKGDRTKVKITANAERPEVLKQKKSATKTLRISIKKFEINYSALMALPTSTTLRFLPARLV